MKNAKDAFEIASRASADSALLVNNRKAREERSPL